MNVTKTVLGYFAWFLYTLMVGVGLVCLVASLGSGAGVNSSYIAFISAVTLLAAGVFAFLLDFFVAKPGKNRINIFEKNRFIQYCFFAICIVAFVFIRINRMNLTGGENYYFNIARVDGKEAIPLLVHNAEYWYLGLLRTIFLCFGNVYGAGIVVQFVLQLLTMILFFFGIKRIAGLLPALFGCMYYAFSPFFVREMNELTPGTFYLFLVVLCMFFISFAFGKKIFSIIVAGIAGLLIGILIYSDLLSIFLILFALGIPIKESRENNTTRGIISFLTLSGTAVLGFVFAILADSMLSGKQVGRVVMSWSRLYGNSIGRTVFSTVNHPDFVCRMILYFFLAVGAFLLLKNAWNNINLFPYTLVCLLFIIGSICGLFTDSILPDGLLLLFLSILSGMSLQTLVLAEQTEEEAPDPENILEHPLLQEEPVKTMTQGTGIQYIENPLPLPKKREHKALDYDYEVAEDDDFDYD